MGTKHSSAQFGATPTQVLCGCHAFCTPSLYAHPFIRQYMLPSPPPQCNFPLMDSSTWFSPLSPSVAAHSDKVGQGSTHSSWWEGCHTEKVGRKTHFAWDVDKCTEEARERCVQQPYNTCASRIPNLPEPPNCSWCPLLEVSHPGPSDKFQNLLYS